MNKIALSLGLSFMAAVPLHSELPAKFKLMVPTQKITTENLASSLKKLMKDCPEFSAMIEGVKKVVALLKQDAMTPNMGTSLSVSMKYDLAAFQEIEKVQMVKSLEELNQMPGLMGVVNNAEHNITISIALDQGLPVNVEASGETGEGGEQDEQAEMTVSMIYIIITTLEAWSSQIEEAIAALDKKTVINPFLAEQLLQLFSIFEFWKVVDHVGSSMFNKDQLKLLSNYQSIKLSLGDLNDKNVSSVDLEINALFDQFISLRQKIMTDASLETTMQQVVQMLSKIMSDYKNQIVF